MAATKVDFKDRLHELYAPGREPGLVEVPELAFLMIDGHGDPQRSPAFGEAVQALFALAYGARFAVRWAPDGIEYGVMPLEGLWSAPDPSAFAGGGDRSTWDWTLMIMQPDRVTPAIVEAARTTAAVRHPLPALARVRLERFAEGTAAQLLHVGPYAAEGPAIARLHRFIARAGCVPAGRHHEIYLGDPRRAAPARLKTILRQPVTPR